MGFDRLEACLSEREGHAETLSEGNTGRQMAQGKSLATDADPLVQCESAGSQASDREPRQENGWCRRRTVGHTADQDCSNCPIEEAAVSTLATTEGLHSKTGKERPLGIPAMRDRAMQALYLLALDPVLESVSDPNSYGFRKERCTADAMEQIF